MDVVLQCVVCPCIEAGCCVAMGTVSLYVTLDIVLQCALCPCKSNREVCTAGNTALDFTLYLNILMQILYITLYIRLLTFSSHSVALAAVGTDGSKFLDNPSTVNIFKIVKYYLMTAWLYRYMSE